MHHKNIIAIAVLPVLFLITPCTWAQESANQDSANHGNSIEQQIKSIYNATQSAKSAKDYTHLLDDCQRVLAEEISQKNRNYITSLTGWAHNRRGVLRMETAQQLRDIGNHQADQAMATAMTDLNAAVKADPKRWRSWMSRGIARVNQQQFESATEDFSQVIKLKPNESKAWFNRAEANYHAGKLVAAIFDYDAVLAMKDHDVQALTGRGHAYFADGKFQPALSDYRDVTQQQPGDSNALINLGDVQQKLGQWKEAEDSYTTALQINPSSSVGLQRFAWLKATCPDATYRDAKTAQEMIEQAVALSGETPALLDTQAAVLAANGDFKTAQQTEEKAIQAIQLTGATTANDSQGVKAEYQTRKALYEEGVPFQQETK